LTSGPLVLVGSDWQRLLRGPDWIRWLAIFLFLALGIGLRSPWPADEPRFALAAMDMLLNDHWLLPHRGGEIYADKPPLFMWLQALFFGMTGDMRTAFLLPSLIASMATLWLVHDLTKRLFGWEQAWYAVLLLVATVQFIVQAKSGQIDATLCAFTTLGIYGLMRHHVLGPHGAWNAVAWLAMGCAIITKGVGFLPIFLLPGIFAAQRIGAKIVGNTAVPRPSPEAKTTASAYGPSTTAHPSTSFAAIPASYAAWRFGPTATGSHRRAIATFACGACATPANSAR
jgi:hypothetical protein